MTDILTKLAALADRNPTRLRCPCCDDHIAYEIVRDGVTMLECRRCGLNICGVNLDDCLRIWNRRPREAALIALVQEATGEIERLRAALAFYEDADYRGTGFWDGISSPGILLDNGNTARAALNPQEAS